MSKTKKRLLFVCLGNICRSPAAEGVMKKMVHDAGLDDAFDIDSAGIGDWHVDNCPMHVCAPVDSVMDTTLIAMPDN